MRPEVRKGARVRKGDILLFLFLFIGRIKGVRSEWHFHRHVLIRTFYVSLLSASFYDTCESHLRFSPLLLKPRRAFL